MYSGPLPKYAERADRNRLVKILCKGRCVCMRWAEMDTDHADAFQKAETRGVTAKCLKCGRIALDSYNWIPELRLPARAIKVNRANSDQVPATDGKEVIDAREQLFRERIAVKGTSTARCSTSPETGSCRKKVASSTLLNDFHQEERMNCDSGVVLSVELTFSLTLEELAEVGAEEVRRRAFAELDVRLAPLLQLFRSPDELGPGATATAPHPGPTAPAGTGCDL
jgi:hypothetical protein